MVYPEYLFDCPSIPPTPAPVLSDQQCAELDAFKAHFGHRGYAVPNSIGGMTKAPLTEREMMFLSQECFFRFRSATKGPLKKTFQKMEKCISWRRMEGLEDLDARAREIEFEGRMGKNYSSGFHASGLPIGYMLPENNPLPFSQRNPKLAMWNLERVSDLMTDGVTQCCIVYKFAGMLPTSYRDAKDTLNMIADYYPEYLGYVLLQETPLLVRLFIHLVWPFVDAHTKQRVQIGGGQAAIAAGDFEPHMLIKECGGGLDLPYNFEEYWPALLAKCKERREIHLQNWRTLGDPVVGRPERLFKLSYPIGSQPSPRKQPQTTYAPTKANTMLAQLIGTTISDDDRPTPTLINHPLISGTSVYGRGAPRSKNSVPNGLVHPIPILKKRADAHGSSPDGSPKANGRGANGSTPSSSPTTPRFPLHSPHASPRSVNDYPLRNGSSPPSSGDFPPHLYSRRGLSIDSGSPKSINSMDLDEASTTHSITSLRAPFRPLLAKGPAATENGRVRTLTHSTSEWKLPTIQAHRLSSGSF